MIQRIFEEIKSEALNNKIIVEEFNIDHPLFVGFNVVDNNNIREDLPNLYIKDKKLFYTLLYEYTLVALNFYNYGTGVDYIEENIKALVTRLLVNITDKEMNCLEEYVKKYFNFICDTTLSNKKGSKETSLGMLNYAVEKQSVIQETPYCFKSYFEKYNARYALPRISFGISDNICYIYSIQNKDNKMNTSAYYNLEVKNKFRTINSGIKKYRNITPSFVIALSLFVSFLKENNITKVKVETPLPLRQNNRELVADNKIRIETQKGILKGETLENFKREIREKNINDDYNSTTKFVNCFNRLKVHFDSIYLSNNTIDDNIFLEIIDLVTQNDFLKEVVKSKEKERYNGKIS